MQNSLVPAAPVASAPCRCGHGALVSSDSWAPKSISPRLREKCCWFRRNWSRRICQNVCHSSRRWLFRWRRSTHEENTNTTAAGEATKGRGSWRRRTRPSQSWGTHAQWPTLLVPRSVALRRQAIALRRREGEPCRPVAQHCVRRYVIFIDMIIAYWSSKLKFDYTKRHSVRTLASAGTEARERSCYWGTPAPGAACSVRLRQTGRLPSRIRSSRSKCVFLFRCDCICWHFCDCTEGGHNFVINLMQTFP